MDPFKDCRRLYSQHFSERMHQYYLPDEQVKMALEDGQRIQEKKGEYVVKWNRWCLAVSHGSCYLVLKTCFRR